MNADQTKRSPTADRSPLLHGELTERIVGAFYTVYNSLGYGFLEKVYENALKIELEEAGITVEQQHPIQVLYRDQEIGEYFADLCVDRKVILELKSVEKLVPGHLSQLYNYLKATSYEVGLLMNFGPKPEFERRIFENKDPQLSVQSVKSAYPL